MIVTARNCLVILVGAMLAAFLTACGSKKETTIASSASPSPIYSHSVALTTSTTFAWGVNNFYELGNGDSNGATQNSPQPVVRVDGTGTLAGITGVSAGGSHTIAFNSTTGEVFAWGNNYYGELGNNSQTITVIPVQVVTDTNSPGTRLTGVTAVSAGMRHSLALDSSNHVWAWGDNTYGQLGLDQTAVPYRLYAATVPTSASSTTPLGNITMIAAGSVHNLALTGGTVYSWGHNGLGQLGYATTTTPNPTPVLVTKQAANPVDAGTTLTNVAEIAAGNTHSLFRLTNGEVWACGYNAYGELGDGTTINRTNGVVQVQGLTGITQIAAGLDHSLALDSSNNVWAWGLNSNGQLGNGLPLNRAAPNSTPAMVKTDASHYLHNVTKIVAIGNHSLAIVDDGTTITLWAWGENTYSQLGLGTGDTTDRGYAVQVMGITNPDLYVQ